jgi:hypothetical protein
MLLSRVLGTDIGAVRLTILIEVSVSDITATFTWVAFTGGRDARVSSARTHAGGSIRGTTATEASVIPLGGIIGADILTVQNTITVGVSLLVEAATDTRRSLVGVIITQVNTILSAVQVTVYLRLATAASARLSLSSIKRTVVITVRSTVGISISIKGITTTCARVALAEGIRRRTVGARTHTRGSIRGTTTTEASVGSLGVIKRTDIVTVSNLITVTINIRLFTTTDTRG